MSGSTTGPAAAARPLRLRLSDVLVALGLAAAMAVVIVRAAVEDRTPLRPLQIRDLRFERIRVDPGQTVTQQLTWTPDGAVYVVGWNPVVQAPANVAHTIELTFSDAETRIFVLGERGDPPGDPEAGTSSELPAGTGYRVPAGRTLTLRLRIANHGTTELSAEAPGAQIRYVPADRDR